MENIKFFCRISQNFWKLPRKCVKPAATVKSDWYSSVPKRLQPTVSLFNGSQLSKPPMCNQLLFQRHYSDDSKQKNVKLMHFHIIVWPNMFKAIKNWIYTNFIIRPYLDPDFSLATFMEGAKQAAQMVSHNLSEGKFDELDGLVSADCLSEVKKNIALMSAKQRQELSIIKEDMYFSFPYELGILFDSKAHSDSQERYVEITVVHHVLRGHKEMLADNQPIPMNIGMQPEFREKMFILNYRFIRNYTKGVSDQWTINVINHFKSTDYA